MKKFAQFNKQRFTHELDTKDFEYYKLETLYKAQPDKAQRVYAIYRNDAGQYGTSYAVLLEKCYINLPQHVNKTCEDILNDSEYIDLINAGKCGIKPRKYTDKNGKERYSVEWIDID